MYLNILDKEKSNINKNSQVTILCITQDMYMNIYLNKSEPQVQHFLVRRVNHWDQALPEISRNICNNPNNISVRECLVLYNFCICAYLQQDETHPLRDIKYATLLPGGPSGPTRPGWPGPPWNTMNRKQFISEVNCISTSIFFLTNLQAKNSRRL